MDENQLSYIPIADRVLVLPDKKQNQTESGLTIPEELQKKSKIGEVIAIGVGKNNQPMQCQVGDRVLYDEYAGQEMEIQGKQYRLIRESELSLIIR